MAKLDVTLVRKGVRSPTPYELKSGHLLLPELGEAFLLTREAEKVLKEGGVVYYADSIFPLDNPSDRIIRSLIEVRRGSNG